MVIKEIADPRLDGISITDVKVDRELAYADIYVSAIEGVTRSKDVFRGLEHASGFLRKSLSDRIELRVFPTIAFSLGSNSRTGRSYRSHFLLLCRLRRRRTPKDEQPH